MAKTKSNRRRGGGGGGSGGGNWSLADHDARTAKRFASLDKKRRRREREEEEEEERAAADREREERRRQTRGQPQQRPPEQDQEGARTKRQRRPPHHEPPVHQLRRLKKRKHRSDLASQVPEDAYKRTHLAHDDVLHLDATKLRLATAAVQRKVDALRTRLEHWDPVEEARIAKEVRANGGIDESSVEHRMKLDAQHRRWDKDARRKAQSEYYLLHAKHGVNSSAHRRKANLKKKPRPGPESWKLRGAARPAREVYDFDVRYVDPHVEALREANEKARRSVNILKLCRGRFALEEGEDDDEDENNGGDAGSNDDNNNGNDARENNPRSEPFPPPQPHCRTYLSLLTQLGSLHLARRNYSSARKSFLEAVELEGASRSHSVTNARVRLMNLYLDGNRPDAARKLWTSLANDEGAWIRYAEALVEYVSWNLLREEGSTERTARNALARAMRGNVYAAYLLGWPATFAKAMEYTEDVTERGAGASPSGTILEAIEYGCPGRSGGGSDDDGGEGDVGMAMWAGTEGSLDWLRSEVLGALNGGEAGGCGDDATDDKDGARGARAREALRGWEAKLRREEEEYERAREAREEERAERGDGDGEDDGGDDDAHSDDEADDDEPDVAMYA
ncbi:hypothetical protein ACHAWF_001787, partial [Thalassiosira exigua]